MQRSLWKYGWDLFEILDRNICLQKYWIIEKYMSPFVAPAQNGSEMCQKLYEFY